MCATLDGDGIDLREQLAPKIVKAYAEWRRRKNKVEYNNGSILVQSENPVDELFRRGLIDDYQRHAALQVSMLREIAFSKLDVASRRDYAHWIDWAESSTSKHAETLYVMVMRAMPKWQSALVERICFQRVGENDYGWLYERRASVQQAFEAVGAEISKQRGILKDRLDKNPVQA